MTMDYEKKYKEALQKIRELIEKGRENGWTIITYEKEFEEIFPELKASDDERIRKSLIILLQHFCKGYRVPELEFPVSYKDMLAWLEKQGEQKPSTIDIDKMVDDYANNKERGNEEFGKPVPCMIRAYRQGLNDAIGKVVLKPAWSEEDEKMLVDAYVMIDWYEGNNWLTARHIKDWLKSLKERIGG